MTKKRNPLRAELRQLLKKYPDTAFMDVLAPDALGILRGKRIRATDFEKACDETFWYCGAAEMLDSLGEVAEGLPGWDDGDPDVPARILPGSLAPVPWSRRPMAQALFRLYENDGTPYFADPRAVLERAIAPLQKMGLRIVMATELEFYLLDAKAERPTAHAPLIAGLGQPQPGVNVYHPDDLNQVQPFLDDVYDYCDAQDIPGRCCHLRVCRRAVRDQSAPRGRSGPGLRSRGAAEARNQGGGTEARLRRLFHGQAICRGHGQRAAHSHEPGRQERQELFFAGQRQPRGAAVLGAAAARGRRTTEDDARGHRHFRAEREFLSPHATRELSHRWIRTGASIIVSCPYASRSRTRTTCDSNIASPVPTPIPISWPPRSPPAFITA